MQRLQQRLITVAVKLKDGDDLSFKNDSWMIHPVWVHDDGFGGATWSESIGFSRLGIEAKFMKKSRSGRLMYKQI